MLFHHVLTWQAPSCMVQWWNHLGNRAHSFWFFLPVGKFFKNILSVCVPTHTVNRRLVDPRSIQGESIHRCPKQSVCQEPFHMTNSTCRTQSAHCTVLVQWKSKTILPKCVACSVPQYNKPNAWGVCESHVHLTYIHGLSVYGVTRSVP
jgi:hypothetical protein